MASQFEIRVYLMDDGRIRAECYDGDAYAWAPTIGEAVGLLQEQEVGTNG